MNIELSYEALEFGREALRALEGAGGDKLVQIAEQEPARRESLVAPVLGELGAWDLDPRGDVDELEAAAALCRSAGWFAVPYPVAERLARPRDIDTDAAIVVGSAQPSAAVADLDLRSVAVTVDGARSRASGRPSAVAPRASAFVTQLDLQPLDEVGGGDVALALVLPCWTLLGMLDRAIDVTRSHVRDREQFGQPLAQFQGVQFQLADAEVERTGADMLAKYALWSIESGSDRAVDDALALRLAVIEAAEIVFRVAHQLHGATGFCDEATVSWLSRHSQPLRRLPYGLSATRDLLTRRLDRRGLIGLYG